MNIRKVSRNKLLLICAEEEFTLEQVSEVLNDWDLNPTNEEEWELWISFLEPLASRCDIHRKEIVYNGRSLSWLARDLKNRSEKPTLS